MRRPLWVLESLRTGRLMALETRRHGWTLPPEDGVTNAVAAQLARAALVLPDRAGARRGRLGRRVDALLEAFTAAALARARLVPAPAPPAPPVRRRSLLPARSGVAALVLLAALHAGSAAFAGRSAWWVLCVALGTAVAVAGPAVLAGRFLALRDHRPDDALPATWVTPLFGMALLGGACVASGGLVAVQHEAGAPAVAAAALFGLLPAAVALTEAASHHPDDRTDRAARRDRRRASRAHRRRQRQWARALARWARAHARLVTGIDAVTGPADRARHRARLLVQRHAARFGWRPAGLPPGVLPEPMRLPDAPVPADELRVPLWAARRFAPSSALADRAADWVAGSVTGSTDQDRRTT